MSTISAAVARVRRFNRFYATLTGALEQPPSGSPLTPGEARIFYEIAQKPGLSAADLCRQLSLDAGYVSRMLAGLKKRRLLERKASDNDARRAQWNLTHAGREAFDALDAHTTQRLAQLLEPLSLRDQDRLLRSLRDVRSLLGGGEDPGAPPARIRPHQPGDLGWIVHRHAVLYHEEYGWDIGFERVVAEIAAHFLAHFDPRADGCWIAEREGERLGSIVVARENADTARLRLFLVEPAARGQGLGKRLIEACHGFARHAGYKRMVLWTQSNLLAARHVYQQAGYRLVSEQPHRSFGKELIAETWEMDL